jgi:hypothetical protein
MSVVLFQVKVNTVVRLPRSIRNFDVLDSRRYNYTLSANSLAVKDAIHIQLYGWMPFLNTERVVTAAQHRRTCKAYSYVLQRDGPQTVHPAPLAAGKLVFVFSLTQRARSRELKLFTSRVRLALSERTPCWRF